MKKIYVTGLGLAVSALIVGCGGGSSSSTVADNGSASAANATISGTVPGTFIEAYCDDGTHVTTNSVQNGTSQHPFTLDVPVNTPCRLVMTTHENDPAQRVTSQVTVNGQRALVVTGDTDIGYVPLPATYAEATDHNGDHVEDQAIDVSPASLNGHTADDTASNPYDDNHNGVVDGLEDRDGNGKADEWDKHDGTDGSGHDGQHNDNGSGSNHDSGNGQDGGSDTNHDNGNGQDGSSDTNHDNGNGKDGSSDTNNG